jgi:hypothetical protein
MKENVDSSGVKSKFYHILKEKIGGERNILGWGAIAEATGKWMYNSQFIGKFCM